jgi:hypothetical protein
MSRKTPHFYFLLWKNQVSYEEYEEEITEVKTTSKTIINTMNVKLGEEKQNAKDKTLKLLAILAKSKPYAFFLLWKNLLKNEKIDNLSQEKKDKIL